MSIFSVLPVYVRGLSVILLLAAVSEAQGDDFAPTPDYDSDYNATFDYSFYSNTSSEDLDRFSEQFMDHKEEEVTVTTATEGSTERGNANVHDTASLPVCLEIWSLVWILMLNLQQD